MTTAARFDRSQATPEAQVLAEKHSGIVHLGIGAFHRAHQADYTHKAMAAFGGDWAITGVSLRSAGVRDQLLPQGGVYTLVQMDANGIEYQHIGAVTDVLVAPENPVAIVDLLVADTTKIVSLTITEKGYCHEPATGRLNASHPDIEHDLANQGAPKTAIGFVVEAIKRRKEKGTAPFTVLCCDNLPSNGDTLKQIVVDYAALVDQPLADWIDKEIPFPNTMVDRIVPATTEDDINALATAKGYQDKAMVKAEAFSQWVVEDRFVSGRPAWDKVGATMVEDVEPFELAKLRLLNGTHSSLAYIGFLCGYEYVDQVVADPNMLAFLQHLMQQEIKPTLEAPAGLNLDQYIKDLLHRFANPELKHRTYQIAMDGSQKLPQRLLGTLGDRLAADKPVEALSFALAAWMRYALGFDEQANDIVVQDPHAATFKVIGDKAYNSETNLLNIDTLLEGYFATNEVFSEALANNAHLKGRVRYWLGYQLANGMKTAVKVFLQEVVGKA